MNAPLVDAALTRVQAAEPVLDARIFDMTNHISAGKYDKAAAVLGDLLRMQTEPIIILGAIGKELRRLYTARMALEHRIGVPEKLATRGAKRLALLGLHFGVDHGGADDVHEARLPGPHDVLVVDVPETADPDDRNSCLVHMNSNMLSRV